MSRRSSKQQYTNSFRVIAGKWRSRRLSFPDDVEALRPTTDRIRETLFNWLQGPIVGASCLDLYSGSGAFAFEAISRGAASVTAIDLSGRAVAAIRDNCRLLECTDIDVVAADCLQWLQQNGGKKKFDVVFLDPPYKLDLLPESLALLAKGGFVAPGGIVYLEADKPLDSVVPLEEWKFQKNKKAGQVFYGVCEPQIN